MPKKTPTTALTINMLEGRGYLVDIVERRIPRANRTKDLFGFIDVLAIKGEETLAVQVTDYSSVSKRIKKIESDELADNVARVRDANWRIEVHGWRKKGGEYVCRVIDLS